MTFHQSADQSIDQSTDSSANLSTVAAGRYLYRSAGPARLYLGDAAEVLAALPDASVDCLVSSPPFWGAA